MAIETRTTSVFLPGAKPPAPQPLNKARHSKAAHAACAFSKAFHRFDPGTLTMTDGGSKFINAGNGFGRNSSIRDLQSRWIGEKHL